MSIANYKDGDEDLCVDDQETQQEQKLQLQNKILENSYKQTHLLHLHTIKKQGKTELPT